MKERYLGLSGGSSETVAIVADESGHILSASRTGGCNYQSVGKTAAAKEMEAAIDIALRAAHTSRTDLTAATFGIAGADRAAEMEIVEQMVEEVAPIACRFVENQALLPIRAVTKDAVGVGLLAGSATNCVGRDRYGRRYQVGGLGPISGDVGYAEDLAMRTVGAAWMASDGRVGPSTLSMSVPKALGVATVEQIPGLMVRGVLPEVLIGRVVECLFEDGGKGDGMALRIIEDTGARLGAAAAAAMRALVLRGANAVVVLAGSVFLTTGHELLVRATERRIRHTVNEAHVLLLDVEPAIGAVLFARDLVGQAPLSFAHTLRLESAEIDRLCRLNTMAMASF